jgi:hypothetical protein
MIRTSLNRVVVLSILLVFLAASCSPTRPLPQPRRVADPGEVQGAVRTSQWDIAAVGYEYPGQGLNYSEAGLDPVYLVFRNNSGDRPVIDPEEARGVAPDGEYLAYSRSEAERLVFASETFSVTASNAARTGGLGAVLGAGLGALIGSVGGGDNIWKGAVIGGAVGGAGGAVASLPEAESRLRRVIREELDQYAWKDNPVPDDYTKVGYLYFPDRDIRKVKLVVRWEGRSETYTVPVAQPPLR